ncbi:MAG TPA: hypothetical protein VHM30_09020 [Gemmatimonadaceae bacterium]|nr:hypothetical protein [Gemmatimonadaceae bacterium]
MTGRAAARLVAAASACVAACAAASPNGAADPGLAAIATRDAVVRVGAFATVPAIALSGTRAFLVGEDGVAIFDRGAQRWLPPIPLLLRQPGMRAARVLAATNLIGDAVWIATSGRVFVLSPNLGATTASWIGGEPRSIRVERGGANAFVLTDRWWIVGATGAARPVAPSELPPPERLADVTDASDPAVRRAIDDPLLTRDDALRSWPVISATRGGTRSDVWLGTAGGGVFHVDPDFHRTEQLAFGLRGGVVLALARAADGIVAAEASTDATGGFAGFVTEGSDDLARWRWHALASQVGGVYAIALRGRTLCIAGPQGAGLIELPARASAMLPATVSRAVYDPAGVAVATRDGCAVGTQRGVRVLPWDGAPPRAGVAADAFLAPVYALAAAGDTIWAGTRDGVVTLLDGKPIGVARPVPAGGPIVALALVRDGLAAATADEVAILTGNAVQRLTLPTAAIGRILTLAADDRTLWIGGASGVLAVTLATRAAVPVPLAPAGSVDPLPLGGAEVRAIVLAPGVAWLGTAAGLVRLRRGEDGLPR